MHRLETVLFSNGERFPILVNVKTGIPDFYSTLWVTVELRNQSAVNTIRNKLGTIQWIMNWEKQNNIVAAYISRYLTLLSFKSTKIKKHTLRSQYLFSSSV